MLSKFKEGGNFSTKVDAMLVKKLLKQFATFLESKQVSPSISNTILFDCLPFELYPRFFNCCQSFLELFLFLSILFAK